MAKASMSNIGALGSAFLNKRIRLPDLITEIRKIKNRDVASDHFDVHGPVSPSWFSSSHAKLAEDGGMGLADYSPRADELCAFSGVTPTDNQSLDSESTDATEKTDQEVFGGSNESLAEKLSMLLTDHLPESSCSIEENDVLSFSSLVSNEAEAVSQDCSPLKNVAHQLSIGDHSCSLNTEEYHIACGGEALADEISSISEIMASSASIDNCSTTSAPSEIFTPDNASSSTGHQIDDGVSNLKSMKPPNILVFTGEDPCSGTISRFDNILHDLELCVNHDCYVIYLLTSVQVLRDPWHDNALLLIVSSDNIPNDIMQQFSTFIEDGGKVLICCSPVNLPSIGISSKVHLRNVLSPVSYKNVKAFLYHGRYKFNHLSSSVILDKSVSPSIIKVPTEKGLLILSEVHLELDPIFFGPNEADSEILKQSNGARLSILQDLLCIEFGLKSRSLEHEVKLTPCHLFTKNEASLHMFFEAICPSLNDNKLRSRSVELNFINSCTLGHSYEATPEVLPILYGPSSWPQNVSFDTNKFFSLLTTKSFGNALIYGEVMTSTMPVVESLSDCDGVVVVAGYQAQGKGRAGNKWLSPKGCAMFSVHFSCSLSSLLGQKLPFVQHMVSLAMVHGIRKIPAFQDLNLRLKWPNDVYYGRQSKIGGVIVNSLVEGENVHFYVGCGVNVSNSHPTFCINDAIHLHNIKTGKSCGNLTVEEVIAFSLNEFEKLTEDFQKQGASAVLPLYYAYWLHQNQKVFISAMKKEATIVGLDDYGFLIVQTDDGGKQTLQPDGNSFDFMKNLISIKSYIQF